MTGCREEVGKKRCSCVFCMQGKSCFSQLANPLCPGLLETSTFISSPHHLLLAGSHPLRSHYVGDLIICQHQTYIRAGICSCFFLQIIGAPPPCSHSSLIKSHLVLNMVSSSPSCALNLTSHLQASHRHANHQCFSKTSFNCVYPQATTQFIFLAVTARHLTVTRICVFTSQAPHLNINKLPFYHCNQVGFAKVNRNLQTDSLNAWVSILPFPVLSGNSLPLPSVFMFPDFLQLLHFFPTPHVCY